jgi:hypothetical protein
MGIRLFKISVLNIKVPFADYVEILLGKYKKRVRFVNPYIYFLN